MTFMIWEDPFHIAQSNFYSWLKRSSLDIYSFYRSHSIASISLLPFSEPFPALPFPFSDEGMKTACSIQGAATTNWHSVIAMCSSIPLLIIPNIGLPFLPVAEHWAVFMIYHDLRISLLADNDQHRAFHFRCEARIVFWHMHHLCTWIYMSCYKVESPVDILWICLDYWNKSRWVWSCLVHFISFYPSP